MVWKGDRDPLDHEYLSFGLYLPDGVGVEAILIEGDLTRRQRAGKSAEQSPAGSGDQVIQRRGMRLLLIRGDAVVLGHFVVYPEEHRFLLGREIGPPGLPLHRLYLHPRNVSYFSQSRSSSIGSPFAPLYL